MDIAISGSAITFSGRFTFADHDGFQRVLEHMKTQSGAVTLDLSRVEFIDSAGLGMLLMARETAEGRSLRLTLKGARGTVAKMFEVSRFNTLFALEP